MNENKLNKLFAAARRSTAPQPPADFADDVLRAARQLPRNRQEQVFDPGVFEQLNAWFPRVALVAATLIVLCVALELGYTSAGTSTTDDNTQVPNQVFFSIDDV